MGHHVDLSKRKRATVRPDGSASFVCTVCGRATRLRPRVPVRPSTPVRSWFRCECGTGHTVYLTTRAARTHLNSEAYIVRRGSDRRLPVRVCNMSRSGVLLELGAIPELALGEEVILQFRLPPLPARRFVKPAAVRRIAATTIAAEFVDGDDHELELALAEIAFTREACAAPPFPL